ncbi:MAG: antitoxin family protein [Desulfurococcales archaeon]|nr:antitoxin family protein [Desulfurococcales archaeon]
MSKVIRVKYENGSLKPLEPLELKEGEEIRILLLPEKFPELVEKVSVEANDDADKALREARER